MDIAIIAAHMDDEVLGCGGTIAKYNIEGHNIHVLVLTDSCSAGHRDIELLPGTDGTVMAKEVISEKKAEFLAAMEVLGGYKTWKICDCPDMRLDTVPHIDLNKKIESFIDEVKPEVVFTHHPGDINLDHRKVFESTMVATRPVPGCPVNKVLCYESMYNNEWFGQPFVPNTYIDITDTLHIKLSAMEAYQSEIQEPPHPRSIRSLINLACTRGPAVGVSAAEAFMMVRNLLSYRDWRK